MTTTITRDDSAQKSPRIRPQRKNANRHTQRGMGMLEGSIERDGIIGAMTVAADDEVFDGSARAETLPAMGFDLADVAQVVKAEPGRVLIIESDGSSPLVHRRVDIPSADDPKAQRLGVAANRVAQVNLDWEPGVLASVNDEAGLGALFFPDELKDLAQPSLPEPGGGGDDFDATPDEGPTRAQLGDLWIIGGVHRLLVGDCTDAANVARLMGGERAALCHGDPPYGMGKEKDGIANDNLYREKLDAFQMAWWRATRPCLEKNASCYIWGIAEDLWRLWYVGGLRDSERLTIRNEIVWQKQGAQGIGSDAHRMYPTASERCLFFMLGEQGFNNNADNYWDGWDSIVEYLERSRQAAGWSIKDTKRIAGHSENSGCHWFDKSQWSMPTREVYLSWQQSASGDAFKREYDDIKREYDDIKREFYSTRAYFDNAHDNMTDVWQYGRVLDEDRHGHATPKPVAMMERIVKSSAATGALVYVPFGGTGPELIAAHRTGRRCYGCEISPRYADVILRRAEAEGLTVELMERLEH